MARILHIDAATVKLREAAELIAADAARRAGVWSKRIPPSFRIEVTENIATITAGGDAAPMAWTNEQPGGPAEGYHPVYGHGVRKHWHWALQPPRPFLAPAAEAMADKAMDKYAEVIDIWARQAGFT